MNHAVFTGPKRARFIYKSVSYSGKDFDESIPRIRATKEGRPDATQGIENDHASTTNCSPF
jgi:hypothetical protein